MINIRVALPDLMPVFAVKNQALIRPEVGKVAIASIQGLAVPPNPQHQEFTQDELNTLKKGINNTDETGRTLLTQAVEENDTPNLLFLIQLGADIHQVDDNGFTPLRKALTLGNLDMVRVLLACGDDLNYDDGTWTPLTWAVEIDCPFISDLILLGADPNLAASDGLTPLCFAAIHNKTESAKDLVKNGADVDKKDKHGWTPLLRAQQFKHREMMKCFILDLKADLKLLGFVHFNQALEDNDEILLEALLKRGFDPNSPDNTGTLPLVRAKLLGHERVSTLLIKYGADEALADEFIHRSFLAAAWGIKSSSKFTLKNGKTIELDLEGFVARRAGLMMLSNYLASFLKGRPEFTVGMKKEIYAVFRNAILETVSEEEIQKKLNEKIPLFILGGVKGHAISFIVHKNQLIVCNRGLGQLRHAIEIYEFKDPKSIDIELILKLQKIHENEASFQDMLKELDLKFIEGFNLKDQKIGHCVWASTKSAFCALLILKFGKEKGLENYKDFTAFSRVHGFKSYLEKSKDPDKSLIVKIKKKFHQKTKASPQFKLRAEKALSALS